MFGIGLQEMLIILVVVLIFFGPKRLPDLAKSLGKGVAEFKKASEEIRKGIDDAVKEGEKADAGTAAGGPGDPGASTAAGGTAAGGPGDPGTSTAAGVVPSGMQVTGNTANAAGTRSPGTLPPDHDASTDATADAKGTPATGNPPASPSAPAG